MTVILAFVAPSLHSDVHGLKYAHRITVSCVNPNHSPVTDSSCMIRKNLNSYNSSLIELTFCLLNRDAEEWQVQLTMSWHPQDSREQWLAIEH